MSYTYLHLSDIHFGQDTGPTVIIHDDVRECLLQDVETLAKSLDNDHLNGVIVTGDIAFSGQDHEYDAAGQWLDKLTAAIGCDRSDVILVPGNHDIDRAKTSPGCRLILDDIIGSGGLSLDRFLEDHKDREVLYERFSSYRTFADAYSCPLDCEGGLSSTRSIEISPGKRLRFIGLNSALLCVDTEDSDQGNLLLGARQRILPRRQDEEIVVLCHHPLDWLRDHEEATRYLYTRARVFIHGHIHEPSVQVTRTPDDYDFMTISAGAVVPEATPGQYTFSYNLISFGWNPDTDGLQVTIVPRLWDNVVTRFVADTVHFDVTFPVVLRCPMFGGPDPVIRTDDISVPIDDVTTDRTPRARDGLTEGDIMSRSSRLLWLRFFRDLTNTQRTHVLVSLRQLPPSWTAELTHNVQHQLLRNLLNAGRQVELHKAIDAVESITDHG